MAIRTEKLGGTDWVDGNVLTAEDLVDTFDGTIEAAVKGQAQIPYTTLKSTGTWINEGYLAADRATTANGVNGTMQTVAPFFIENDFDFEYTLHNPNDFNNPLNAFVDNNDIASKSNPGSAGVFLGITFSERFFNVVRVTGSTSTGSTSSWTAIKMQYYNGSSWLDLCPVYGHGSQFNNNNSFSMEVPVNMNIQGIRIAYRSNSSSSNISVSRILPIKYNNNLEDSVKFNNEKYEIFKYKLSETIFRGIAPNTASDSISNYSISGTIKKRGFFTNAFISGNTNPQTIGYDIFKNGILVSSASASLRAGGFAYLSFPLRNTQDVFEVGDTFEIKKTGTGNAIIRTNVSENNDYYEYTNQTVPAYNSTHSSDYRVGPMFMYQEVEYNDVGSMQIKDNLLKLDDNSITALYNDSLLSQTDTSIHATISDGTLETDEFELQPQKSTLIPLLANMSGDMIIKFKLQTADPTKSPELYGYGVYLQ